MNPPAPAAVDPRAEALATLARITGAWREGDVSRIDGVQPVLNSQRE